MFSQILNESVSCGCIGVSEKSFKKPIVWITVVAIILLVAVAVCFFINPFVNREIDIKSQKVSDLNTNDIIQNIKETEKLEEGIILYANKDNTNLTLTADFEITNQSEIGFYYAKKGKTYSAQLKATDEANVLNFTKPKKCKQPSRAFKLNDYLDALKYLPQKEIKQIFSADAYSITQVENVMPEDFDHIITYSQKGISLLEEVYIHLEITPLNKDGETLHLFYGQRDANMLSSDSVTMWFDYLPSYENVQGDNYIETTLPSFSNLTFRCNAQKMEALVGEEKYDLYEGMPILSVYFCDFTGDGMPELCSTVGVSKDTNEKMVIIYDYSTDVSYEFQDSKNINFTLRQGENGRLYVDKKSYTDDTILSSGLLVFKDGCVQPLE